MPPKIKSAEFKALLRLEKFAVGRRDRVVEEFWRHVELVVSSLNGVSVTGSLEETKRRWVYYIDTEGFDIWGTSHKRSCRERTTIKDGKPEPMRRVSVKYRDDDIEVADDALVLPNPKAVRRHNAEDAKEKLEEDVVLKHGEADPLRRIFSKSGQAEFPDGSTFETVGHLAEVFHELKKLKPSIQDKKLAIVNDFVAHEVKYEGAEIKLDGKCKADVALTFWHRGRKVTEPFAKGELVVAEFSFDYKLKKCSAAHTAEIGHELLTKLGSDDWMLGGGDTKTQIAYKSAGS
ncbi:MAG: hypothetical protein E2P02_28590 [Acidobacteria bacterium]|nr:MAG: hypothetical protein E2P02_28590 [Acidobacteriota bacterium]